MPGLTLQALKETHVVWLKCQLLCALFTLTLRSPLVTPSYLQYPATPTAISPLASPYRTSGVIPMGYPYGLSLWVIPMGYPYRLSLWVIPMGYPYRLPPLFSQCPPQWTHSVLTVHLQCPTQGWDTGRELGGCLKLLRVPLYP